jgi:hypothetical protein
MLAAFWHVWSEPAIGGAARRLRFWWAADYALVRFHPRVGRERGHVGISATVSWAIDGMDVDGD